VLYLTQEKSKERKISIQKMTPTKILTLVNISRFSIIKVTKEKELKNV
jgi:hypothetical protein